MKELPTPAAIRWIGQYVRIENIDSLDVHKLVCKVT